MSALAVSCPYRGYEHKGRQDKTVLSCPCQWCKQAIKLRPHGITGTHIISRQNKHQLSTYLDVMASICSSRMLAVARMQRMSLSRAWPVKWWTSAVLSLSRIRRGSMPQDTTNETSAGWYCTLNANTANSWRCCTAVQAINTHYMRLTLLTLHIGDAIRRVTDLQFTGCELVQVLAGHHCVVALGKLLTPSVI